MSKITKVEARRRSLDEKGNEICDPTPAAVSVGFKRPPTLQEQIQRLVRTELSDQAAAQGNETFEEADDFEVGDDYDPKSKYEIDEHLPSYNDDRVKSAVRSAVEEELKARGYHPEAPSRGSSGRPLKKRSRVGSKAAEAPEDSSDESDED